jgi:hypothetical protein
LVLKSPQRPSEIASASGVARAEVHRHLRDLEKKGFCVVVGERGKKYSAISPSEALGSLVEQEEGRRQQMIKKKSALISEWNSSQHPFSSMEAEPERFQVLRDAQIALERGINLAIESKKTCRVALRMSTLKEFISSEMLQTIEFSGVLDRVSQKSGVHFRVLLISPTDDVIGLREVFGKVELPVNAEVRWTMSPMLEFFPDAVIKDDDELLIHTPPVSKMENGVTKERDSKAVVTNVAAMIASFIAMFDQHWANAENLRL